MLDSDFDVLYASTAVEDTIPDIKKARELNIPVKRRSDLLAEIFASYPHNIAVGGTSGKSTVTAMIGYILDCAGKNPLVINGALLKNYEKRPGIPNVVLNNGRCCVIEADESDGSIEKYTPYIAVINNISLDHKPINELQTLFGDFARRAVKGAVINLDNINSRNLPGLAPKTVTFGITDPNADLFAENITAVSDGTAYVFRGKNYKLSLIGAFNVANAMCAAAACSLLDIQPEVSCKILEGFLGTKRRLEVLGQASNITVIDDFAHNPDKVKRFHVRPEKLFRTSPDYVPAARFLADAYDGQGNHGRFCKPYGYRRHTHASGNFLCGRNCQTRHLFIRLGKICSNCRSWRIILFNPVRAERTPVKKRPPRRPHRSYGRAGQFHN